MCKSVLLIESVRFSLNSLDFGSALLFIVTEESFLLLNSTKQKDLKKTYAAYAMYCCVNDKF